MSYRLPIKDSKSLINVFIGSLRLHDPKWHPDWKQNLGYKLARILFLAGATGIRHSINKNQAFDIYARQPPLHKQTIYIYPHIDSSLMAREDKIDKTRPLIWNLFDRFGIKYSGCAHGDYTQLSSVQEMELYSDIVLHFDFFINRFVVEK